MTRYFITFCHFPTLTSYNTGWVTSSNDEGNFVSDQYIIDYLNVKYPIKTSKIEIIESVEITETEFNRFNLILDTND
jgi:hypothetical protein